MVGVIVWAQWLGYTYFQGGNEACVYDDYIDFQDNQSTNLLGYNDYTVWRGHSTISSSYQSRIISSSSYESGDKWSDQGWYDTGGVTHTVITYNANGGSGAPGNQDKWYGESLYLSNTRPTRTGYTFRCWNTASNGTGTTYNPGDQYGPDPGGTVTLYAIWDINTWQVTYNGNGTNVTNIPAAQTKTYNQTLVLTSQIPQKIDYNFMGWNTKADGTGTNYAAGANYTGNAALILYAKWELAYVKPRYTNLSISRCDSSGTKSESGTYLRVDFNWATDLTGVYAKIQYRESTVSSWTTASIFDNNNNNSGTVTNKIIGSNNFTIEKSYIARIYIYDSKGTSYATYSGEFTIGTVSYPIDVRKQGKGVAFGKVAETDDLMDVNFNAKFRKNLVVHNQRIERKLALVGRSDNQGSNFWYRFAKTSINGNAHTDRSITFLVHSGYYDNTDGCGILTAHIRTENGGRFTTCHLEWEYCGPDIYPGDFRIYYPNSDASITSYDVELWCYVGQAWRQYHFDVLSEYTRTTGNDFDLWSVYNTVTQSGSNPPSSLNYKDSIVKENMSGGKNLYYNEEGTAGTVSLSVDAGHFRCIEIYYKDQQGNYPGYSSVKAYNPNGKRVELTVASKESSSSTAIRLNTRSVIISGTSITIESYQVNYVSGGGQYTVNEQRIIRVVGYR